MVLLATAGVFPVSSFFTVRLILNSLCGYKGAEMIRQLVFGKGELSRELQEMLAYMNLITGYYVPNSEQIPVLSDEGIRRLLMPILYLAGEYTDVYGWMAWNDVAPTLTSKCCSLSNGRFGHPEQNRAISFREAVALQTFPNDYVSFGNQQEIGKQIGNAVPVLLAQALANAIQNI